MGDRPRYLSCCSGRGWICWAVCLWGRRVKFCVGVRCGVCSHSASRSKAQFERNLGASRSSNLYWVEFRHVFTGIRGVWIEDSRVLPLITTTSAMATDSSSLKLGNFANFTRVKWILRALMTVSISSMACRLVQKAYCLGIALEAVL